MRFADIFDQIVACTAGAPPSSSPLNEKRALRSSISGTFEATLSSATTRDGCFARAPASGLCGARASGQGCDGSDGTR
jgi:hypothetical protein